VKGYPLHLQGITVLDNEVAELEGVRFFGSTLRTDLSGRSESEITAVRKGMGEYFFVKTRTQDAEQPLAKLRPNDTSRAHEAAWAKLKQAVTAEPRCRTVVITHHPPSALGANPRFSGNGLDPAYVSNHDEEIAIFENVPVWVHGHTHIAKAYKIGNTILRSNALGFAAKSGPAPGFSVKAHFDIS
jgi:hypothetical protein